MQSSSEASLNQSLTNWEGVLNERHDNSHEFARELFEAATIVKGSAPLLRSITDPARDGEDRADLARAVFGGKAEGEVVDLLAGLARRRWAEGSDFVEAISYMGVQTLLVSAQLDNRLDEVEEDMYRAVRLLSSERRLRIALQDRSASVESRIELAHQVFGRLEPETRALLDEAIREPGRESIISHLRTWIGYSGQRAEHLVAIVTAAVPMEQDQEERLTSILERMYERPVTIHVGIDPAIIGGLRIRIGDDVIDGTLASRINEVKAAL